MVLFLFSAIALALAGLIIYLGKNLSNWDQKIAWWHTRTRIFFAIATVVLLILVYQGTRIPKFRVFGIELTPGQEVVFGWNDTVGHFISNREDEYAILKLKLLPDGQKNRIQLTPLNPRFLFNHRYKENALKTIDKYLNVVPLTHNDRFIINGKEVTFWQRDSVGIVHNNNSAHEYEHSQSNNARKLLAPLIGNVYSGAYIDLGKLPETESDKWQMATGSTQLCIFRKSRTSQFFLTGPGLQETLLNGQKPIGNKPTYQFDATGRLRWSRWDDARITREIYFKTTSQGVTLTFRGRHTVSLGNTEEIQRDSQKILISNQQLPGTNPQIYLPDLFPEQPFLSYLKLERPSDAPGDFIYSSGVIEYPGIYNHRLPSPSLSHKVQIAVTHYTLTAFMTLLLCLMLIFILNGYFWRQNSQLHDLGPMVEAFYFLVEVLLFIRLGFGLKASLQPPYEVEALSNSLFAFLYVPYLIYLCTQGGRQWLRGEFFLRCVWSLEAGYTALVCGFLFFLRAIGYADTIALASVVITYGGACFAYLIIYALGYSPTDILTRSNTSRRDWLLDGLIFGGAGLLLFLAHASGGGEAVYLLGSRIPLTLPAYFYVLFLYIRGLILTQSALSNLATKFGILRRIEPILMPILGVLIAFGFVIIEIGLSGDFGFFVYLLPLTFLLLFGTIRESPVKIWGAIVLIIVVTAAAISPTVDIMSEEWKGDIQGAAHRFYTRTASLGTLEQDPSRKAFTEYSSLRTMMFYATRGFFGEGYLNAPVLPVLYQVGLNDQAYAVFTLAEHGALGGLSLLAIYFGLLCFGLFAIQKRLTSQQNATHAIIAFGLLTTITLVSYYMMAGNVKVVAFTGRNMFFFGLNSYADIWHASLLVALFIGLLCTDAPPTPQKPNPQSAEVNRALLVSLSLLTLVLAGTITWRTFDQSLQKPFKPQGYYDWVNQLIDQKKLIITRNRKIAVQNLSTDDREKQRSSYLDKDIREFNSGNAGIFETNPQADGTYRLREINPFQRLVASPFRDERQWRGTIQTTSVGAPRYLQVGTQAFHITPGAGRTLPKAEEFDKVRITGAGGNTSPAFRATIPYKQIRSNVYWQEGFDIFGYGDDVVLRAHQPLHLNGIQLRPGATLRIESGDVVAWKNFGRPNIPASAIFLQGDTNLVHLKWENGRQRISYPHGESAAFVQQLKYALERSSDRNEPVVTLTLDVPLNRQLTERLEQRERVRRRAKKSPFKSRREAVTVMDTFTGEVLAMATWPTFNPNQTASLDALSDSLRDENQARYRMARKNLNFMSHVMGSSQKPFTALAALHVRPEILTLSVDHQGRREFKQLFHFSFETGFQSTPPGRVGEEVAWRHYLPHSNNLFHLFMGTYALMDKGTGELPATTSHRSIPRYRFQSGNWYTRSPRFSGRYLRDDILVNIERSDLFQEYRKFFKKPVTRSGMGDDDPFDTAGWQPLINEELLDDKNPAIRPILPEATNLQVALLKRFRQDWISFHLGGGTCLWNNVEAAEAFSRLVTGNAVVASFVPVTQTPQSISRMNPRYRLEILDRLEEVVTIGTARNTLGKKLKTFLPSYPNKDRLVVYAKTGTLRPDEKQPNSSIFLLFLGFKDSAGKIQTGLTTVIYIEKQGVHQADAFAGEILPNLISILEARSHR